MTLLMITLTEYYMGRDETHPLDLTPEIAYNSAETVRRANLLLEAFGEDRTVTSGWRPPSVNAGVPGAAKKSNHMLGLAIDLADANGKLDAFCLANSKPGGLLEQIGLWLEHPEATKSLDRYGEGWCHVQTVPPRSGRRVFYP